MNSDTQDIFLRNRHVFHPIVSFNANQHKLVSMDFTSGNKALTNDIIENTVAFSHYIKNTLAAARARYGIGGYAEHRTVYSRSGVFDADETS